MTISRLVERLCEYDQDFEVAIRFGNPAKVQTLHSINDVKYDASNMVVLDAEYLSIN